MQQELFPPERPPVNDRDDVIPAFTFWSPWTDAIVREVPRGATAPTPKRVDNRPRPPPRNRIGRLIALHNGKHLHREGLARLRETLGYDWTEADLSPPGLILGVARIVGVIDPKGPLPTSPEPWWFGPQYEGRPNFGWRLDNVQRFETPVYVERGYLGLWPLSDNVLRQVRDRLA